VQAHGELRLSEWRLIVPEATYNCQCYGEANLFFLCDAQCKFGPIGASLGWILVVIGDAATNQGDKPTYINEKHHGNCIGESQIDILSLAGATKRPWNTEPVSFNIIVVASPPMKAEIKCTLVLGRKL
jgi:hypothetical protein